MWFIASNICQWRSQNKISVCPRKSIWNPRCHSDSYSELSEPSSVFLCSCVCFSQERCVTRQRWIWEVSLCAWVLVWVCECVWRSVRSVPIHLLTGQAVSATDKQTAQLITGNTHTHTLPPAWPSLSCSDPAGHLYGNGTAHPEKAVHKLAFNKRADKQWGSLMRTTTPYQSVRELWLSAVFHL